MCFIKSDAKHNQCMVHYSKTMMLSINRFCYYRLCPHLASQYTVHLGVAGGMGIHPFESLLPRSPYFAVLQFHRLNSFMQCTLHSVFTSPSVSTTGQMVRSTNVDLHLPARVEQGEFPLKYAPLPAIVSLQELYSIRHTRTKSTIGTFPGGACLSLETVTTTPVAVAMPTYYMYITGIPGHEIIM